MIGVIEYYEEPPSNYREAFLPGQIYWAPISFVLDEQPRRLRLDYYDPEKPQNASYTLLRTNLEDYGPGMDHSLRHLGLASDEVLLAAPHKKRPAIIISDPLTSPGDIVENYSGYIVIPCYSVCDETGNYKQWATREIVLRARAYQLKSVFYLPLSEKFRMVESLARLDRLQFVRVEHLIPRPVRLTEDATNLLREWVYHYMGAPIFNPALEEFIERTRQSVDRLLRD